MFESKEMRLMCNLKYVIIYFTNFVGMYYNIIMLYVLLKPSLVKQLCNFEQSLYFYNFLVLNKLLLAV